MILRQKLRKANCTNLNINKIAKEIKLNYKMISLHFHQIKVKMYLIPLLYCVLLLKTQREFSNFSFIEKNSNRFSSKTKLFSPSSTWKSFTRSFTALVNHSQPFLHSQIKVLEKYSNFANKFSSTGKKLELLKSILIPFQFHFLVIWTFAVSLLIYKIFSLKRRKVSNIFSLFHMLFSDYSINSQMGWKTWYDKMLFN